MLARMPSAVAARERLWAKGLEPLPPRDDLDFSSNFLYMVHGEVPSEAMRKAFDLSLVLYAEHELNASTFAGPGHGLHPLGHLLGDRRGDRHAQGVAPRRGQRGSLEGPRAGGISRERRDLDPGGARPQGADHGLRPPGLQDGRPPGPDPQVPLRHDSPPKIGDDRWERMAEPIEKRRHRAEAAPARTSTGRAPGSTTTWAWKSTSTRPIFAMARVAGWAAHIIEQLDHNRLMRPRARYVGPPVRPVPPITARG